MAGLDPEIALDRTCGELMEYIRAWQERWRIQAMALYNQAATIAAMCFSKHRPRPHECFPGLIEPAEMTAGQIAGSLELWTSQWEAQEAAGS